MKYILLLLSVISVSLISCKRDQVNTTIATLNGKVYNLCNDSGLAGVTVYLKENGSIVSQVNSSTDGTFSFKNVSIRGDEQYVLFIPSKSGIGGGPEIGFDGDNANLDNSHPGNFITLHVVPHAKKMNLYYPAHSFPTIADTFSLVLDQNIYRKYFPNGVYQIDAGNSPTYPPSGNNYIGSPQNYWMGWWTWRLDRTINGVHTVTQDSLYVGWGGTVTDTIPW